ncbi:nuclear transport factor 2 family protein [Microbacterium yannicii]|uniref:nuclear transport factor 2 family protein n=1 Tax=Microbacterium yannicii TaxID=671622 RepID=UPI0003622CED|nr:nuclear transport factor 2 family protein [Microbacterium yannicii]
MNDERGQARSSTLEDLIDKQDIQEVILRYVHGVDRLDWELVRDCYWPDAVDDHGAFRGDPEGFIEWGRCLKASTVSTTHQVSPSLIVLDGDHAQVETYCLAFHRQEIDRGARDAVMGVRYADRFERRGGQWRILERTAIWDWLRVDDVAVPADEEWSFGPDHVRGSRGVHDMIHALAIKLHAHAPSAVLASETGDV